MLIIAKWALAVFAIEQATQLLVESKIFFRLRTFLSKKSNFLKDLISCGHCTSIWVSACFAWALEGSVFNHPIPDFFVRLLVVSALANFVHRFVRSRDWVLVLHNVNENNIEFEENTDGEDAE